MLKILRTDGFMKLLAVLGGAGGIYFGLKQILIMRIAYISTSDLLTQIFSLNGFLGFFIGVIIASLTVLITIKPNDPLPWHWAMLFLLGVPLFFFNHILSGFAVIGGGFVGIFKKS